MCTSHFNPVCCIIPPYMSDKLTDSTDKAAAKAAIANEVENNKLRAKRDFVSSLPQAKMLMLHPSRAQKAAVKLNMQVFDNKHATDPKSAQLIWDNGKPLKRLDASAKNVVAGGTATWDLYNKIYGRNSVDNLGLLLRHYIHFGKKYDNAMWDGSEMVYGDGDGKIFGNFTSDPDIIGHELTHGVTQYESDLAYHNQSGALNESLSDVFGIMVKQRMLNQDVKTSNWLIGENVVLGKKYALRSMKAPGTAYVRHPQLGTDPQPATMDKFVHMADTSAGDWGGVHINSGITNFAFYIAAYNIGGFAWEKAGLIWYNAMTDTTLSQNATFEDFKKLTIKHATKLYNAGSKELKAVQDAWNTAKV